MKKLISIFITLACVAPAFATTYGGQTDTTSTTLTSSLAAVTQGNQAQLCVASATNINTPSISQAGTYLVIGKEADQVLSAGASATCFNVRRGVLGTSAAYGHPSGENVWVGNVATGTGDSSRPFSGGAISANAPNGNCTASAQYSLPLIFIASPNTINSGYAYYCYAGIWTSGFGQQNLSGSFTNFSTYIAASNVVAPVAVTDVSGKLFFSQIFVSANMKTTGACLQNGATVGTDLRLYGLWDAAGTLLASTLGTATSGASLLQCIAWITPLNLTGPNTYYVGIQANGTTDNFSAYKTGGAPTNYLVGSQTGTYGQVAMISPLPTTFTTAVGPYMSLY